MDIHCRRATELVSDSMHRRLRVYERLTLNLHLMICKACRAYRKQVRLIRATMQDEAASTDGLITPEGGQLSADARERIDSAIRERMS